MGGCATAPERRAPAPSDPYRDGFRPSLDRFASFTKEKAIIDDLVPQMPGGADDGLPPLGTEDDLFARLQPLEPPTASPRHSAAEERRGSLPTPALPLTPKAPPSLRPDTAPLKPRPSKGPALPAVRTRPRSKSLPSAPENQMSIFMPRAHPRVPPSPHSHNRTLSGSHGPKGKARAPRVGPAAAAGQTA